MAIAGRTYLERGEPVEVICGWGPGGGPRNVWVRRQDGTEVVRPFRGPPQAEAANQSTHQRPSSDPLSIPAAASCPALSYPPVTVDPWEP